MLKKRIAGASFAAIAAAMVIGGTGAYFTTSEQAHNVITTGGVDIELIEVTDKQDGEGNPVPFANVTDAMPGDVISKIPMVKNTESQSVWARVKVIVSAKDAEGKDITLPEDILSVDYNTESWEKGADGFWYYKTAVGGGETSAPLFEHVTIDKAMGNGYQGIEIHVDLDAQAVQTANNGSTAAEAAGWPL